MKTSKNKNFEDTQTEIFKSHFQSYWVEKNENIDFKHHFKHLYRHIYSIKNTVDELKYNDVGESRATPTSRSE